VLPPLLRMRRKSWIGFHRWLPGMLSTPLQPLDKWTILN
jgi:hypothetical protein